MTRAELMQMFKTKATEIAEKDFSKITEENVIADLGIDSLAMLELVGEFERELKVTIPDEQLVGLSTVRQLLDVVHRRAQ